MAPLTPEVGLYAFWRYDLFPYLLGGSISKVHKDGRVEIMSYGPGYTFKPLFVLPGDLGARLRLALEELEGKRRHALQKLDLEYRDQVCNLLEVAGIDKEIYR